MTTPIVFFHIPKCGGTTATDIFKNEYGDVHVKTETTYIDYFVTPSTYNEKYRLYGGHVTYDCLPLLPKTVRFFTIFRNPADRILSLYSYYHKSQSFSGESHVSKLAKSLDFHDWLECGNPEVIFETSNAIIRPFVPYGFFHSNYPACKQNILAVAETFLNSFDVVGFVERMDLTIELLRQTYGLSQSCVHNKILNASHSETINYSSSRLMDFVHSNCQLDIEFMRYALCLFRRQCPDDLVKHLGNIENDVLGSK